MPKPIYRLREDGTYELHPDQSLAQNLEPGDKLTPIYRLRQGRPACSGGPVSRALRRGRVERVAWLREGGEAA